MLEPPAFHPERPGLVVPVRADPAGESGPTRKQARGPHWRKTSYGFYVPASVATDDPQQRCVEASALLRPGDAITGWAALNWVGGRWFAGTSTDGSRLPVAIAARKYLAVQPGFDVSQEFVRPAEVELVDGLPVTAPSRSVSFEMRHADSLRLAVIALDMAAFSDLVSISELGPYVAALMAPTGVGQARKALALADENSWSPQEVVMRLVWTHEGDRPRPLCNVPVFDRWGRHIATPDLLDPEAGVAGEYDSALHLVGTQRTRDVRREGELRGLGLEYVTMLGSDRTDDYRSFLARLGTAYARAPFAAEATRLWTIRPPAWWVDTTSVDARRNLTPELRSRLLRHRRAA